MSIESLCYTCIIHSLIYNAVVVVRSFQILLCLGDRYSETVILPSVSKVKHTVFHQFFSGGVTGEAEWCLYYKSQSYYLFYTATYCVYYFPVILHISVPPI